jgi:hypothetical protein
MTCGCNCTLWPTTWGPSLRCIELPEEMADWSLTSLLHKLIKMGARVVRYVCAI